MMGWPKRAWRRFATAFAQDDFDDDWYGYLTNQISHTLEFNE